MDTNFKTVYTRCDVCGQRMERRAPIIEFDICPSCYNKYSRRVRKEVKEEAKKNENI